MARLEDGSGGQRGGGRGERVFDEFMNLFYFKVFVKLSGGGENKPLLGDSQGSAGIVGSTSGEDVKHEFMTVVLVV